MTISFGACESSAGPGGVAFWDNLFQTAAAEGISVFVSSGDSGASGCDTAFSAPPALPKANSPNYICSSSYATCVGGTQFADTASPSDLLVLHQRHRLSLGSQLYSRGRMERVHRHPPSPPPAEASAPSSPPPPGKRGPACLRPEPDATRPTSPFRLPGTTAISPAWPPSQAAVASPRMAASASSPSLEPQPPRPAWPAWPRCSISNWAARRATSISQLYPLAASVPSAFHDATVASSGVSGCTVKHAQHLQQQHSRRNWKRHPDPGF